MTSKQPLSRPHIQFFLYQILKGTSCPIALFHLKKKESSLFMALIWAYVTCHRPQVHPLSQRHAPRFETFQYPCELRLCSRYLWFWPQPRGTGRSFSDRLCRDTVCYLRRPANSSAQIMLQMKMQLVSCAGNSLRQQIVRYQGGCMERRVDLCRATTSQATVAGYPT